MNQPPLEPSDIDDVLKRAFEPPTEGAHTFHHEVDVSDIDLTDNSQEESLIREDSQRDGVHVPDLPDVDPVDPESAFDMAPVEVATDILQNAFTKDFDFAQISVGVVERDRFYRCGLHDEEMYFIVEPPGTGLRIKVAFPPASHAEAAIAALDAWVEAKHIGTNSVQYLHGFQLLNVWMMVREINGKPTNWYEQAVEDAGGKITYRKLRDLLSDPESVESVRGMNEVRWSAVSLAVRIADYQHHLCVEALRSRKVFTTAGSA